MTNPAITATVPRKRERAPNAGRRIGSTNHLTKELKDMIREALGKAGGVDYLARQAEENPTAFMSLLGKLIPHEIAASLNASITERHYVVALPAESLAGPAKSA